MQANLPRPYFFKLAEQLPLAVITGRIYLLDEAGSSKDYFLLVGQRYGLVEAQTLLDLEQVYAQEFAKEIDLYKAEYLREEIDHRIAAIKEMESHLADDCILNFLVNKMIPKLARMHGRALEEGPPSSETEEPNLLNEGVATVQESQRQRASMLESLLKQDVLVLDGQVYKLIQIGNQGQEAAELQNRDLLLRVRGRTLGLSASCLPLAELEQQFKMELEKELKKQALAEVPERAHQLQEIQHNKKRIEALLLKHAKIEGGLLYLYQDPKSGVVKIGNAYYVYLEVPAHVLQDPNNPRDYYYFDRTRVGTVVTYANGQINFQHAVVMTPYEHPFLNRGKAFTGFCMGRYDKNKLINLPLEDAIYTFLTDAKNVLIKSYHKGNPGIQYHAIAQFPERKISLEEVKKRGLPITNLY